MQTPEAKQAEDLKKTSDAIKKQMVDSDPNEGEIVAVEYTVDGEILIVRKDGADTKQPIPIEEYKGLPKRWRGQHTKAMIDIAYLIGEVKKFTSRKIPLTREECVDYGIDKKSLKHLEKSKLIIQRIITMNNRSGKSVGGKMIIYFTPQGKAYMDNAWKQWGENGGKNGGVSGNS